MKAGASLILVFMVFLAQAQEAQRDFAITKKYLNIPIQQSQDRQWVTFDVDGNYFSQSWMRLSKDQTDYWVYTDVSQFKGKTITLTYPEKASGFDAIYQSDQMAGADSLYKEKYRPQFHYTTQRGHLSDPNGLVYYNGEFHMFYQHNPYEIIITNEHWGHAVSQDLLHWEELPPALHPDEMGIMASGSGAIDFNNSSGFQEGEEKPMILAYTAFGMPRGSKQVQCIAYSNDAGRTWTKYEGNPLFDSREKWNSNSSRDPKIFWHDETKKWIMVLYEKTGHSIYNSADLKDWTYQSNIGGQHECPELFELPVDGDNNNRKWVVYGASGTYLIGDFDGKSFKAESGKHRYASGNLYAAQTFTNVPESDGRRIQLGWGREITKPGMPFSQVMLFPIEFSLRSTRNGVRMFSEPISEIEQLHKKSHQWSDLTIDEANSNLKSLQGDFFHIKMKIEIVEGTEFAFHLDGNPIAKYDMNFNLLNGVFYEGDDIENLTMSLEILVDISSVETFADEGLFSTIAVRQEPKNDSGFEFFKRRPEYQLKIHNLEVYEMASIWE